MSTQGNVKKRTVPVILLRVAGCIGVLGCLIAVVGFIAQSNALVNLGSGTLLLAVATAVAALIARIAR